MPTSTTSVLDDALTKTHEMIDHQAKRIVGGRSNFYICTLAVFTPGAHTCLYGEPGVAKSMLFDGLSNHAPDNRWFKSPAFKGSPPEQFLGPLSLSALERDEYKRIILGKFGWAEYVFIDELFRAPRAVLPAFQTGMSDGVMDNGNGMEKIPLRTFFGATNSLPEAGDDDLAAFRDRFTFTLVVEPVQSQDGFVEILDGFLDRRANGGGAGVPSELLLSTDEIDEVIAASCAMPFDQSAKEALAQLRSNLLNDGIKPSARRLNSLAAAMQTDALLRGASSVTVDNLKLAREALWTDIDEREQVARRVLEFASEFEKRTAALADEYAEMRAELLRIQSEVAQTGSANVTDEANNATLRLLRRHQVLRPRIQAHKDEAMGRDTNALDDILEEMDQARAWASKAVLGGLEV